MSFPSTCFHQAQVCRLIIPQLLSLLMELSTNKSKILCSYHSTTVISSIPSHPCRALSLSRNQFLSCFNSLTATIRGSCDNFFCNMVPLSGGLARTLPAKWRRYPDARLLHSVESSISQFAFCFIPTPITRWASKKNQ